MVHEGEQEKLMDKLRAENEKLHTKIENLSRSYKEVLDQQAQLVIENMRLYCHLLDLAGQLREQKREQKLMEEGASSDGLLLHAWRVVDAARRSRAKDDPSLLVHRLHELANVTEQLLPMYWDRTRALNRVRDAFHVLSKAVKQQETALSLLLLEE